MFVSVANRDKRSLVFPVKRLADLGFRVLATEGTAEMLRRTAFRVTRCASTSRRRAPTGPRCPPSTRSARGGGHGDQHPYGNSGPRIDGYEIRSAAVAMNIPCVTTVQGASAAVQGIEEGIRGDIGVRSLQEAHSPARCDAVTGFGARLAEAMSARGPLCLGIDPHPEMLTAWGLPVDADGLAAFCDVCVEAYAGLRGGQAAGRILRDLRCRRLLGAGAHHRGVTGVGRNWCWPTPSAVTSVPRWPHTGGLGRRVAAGV